MKKMLTPFCQYWYVAYADGFVRPFGRYGTWERTDKIPGTQGSVPENLNAIKLRKI
jgi:hypothetical protein